MARAALVAAVLLVAPACLPPSASQRAEVQEKLPPQVSLYGVRLRSWSGSELVAQGRAARLTYDRQSTRFVASEGLIQFPRPDGEVDVRAPVFEGEMGTRLAQGSGGVTVRSSSGVRGSTPSATFDGNTLIARGTEEVDAEGPGFELAAGGFTFHFATDELLFDGPVTSLLEEKQP